MSLTTAGLGRLQLGAWIALVTVCALAVARATLFDDAVPFVRESAAAFITTPAPMTADLIAVMPEDPPAFTFVRRFDGAAGLARARLRGHALRRVEITLNGRPVAVPGDGAAWKRGFSADVAPLLRDGRNELRATVTNVHGPPLLALAVETGAEPIATDARWQVTTGGANPITAVLASDTRIHPESRLLPSTGQALASLAPILIALFAAGTAAAWLAAARLTPALRARAPDAALGAVAAFWLLVYLAKGVRMPVALGFDAHAHLLYIAYLIERLELPTAAYGFSTYHPPAFHALAAVLVALFGVTPESAGGAAVYRAVPLLAGLATVYFTSRVARALWPGESLRPTLATLVAGLLPMNVYMASYVSNEALHAAFVSGALLLATRLLQNEAFSWRVALALGGVLGLGLLTKFTSLAIAPLIAAFAAGRVWLVDRGPPLRAAAVGAAVIGLAGAISGWFYLRNWLVFGDPLVWNLDVPGAATWWMLPGFHTASAYLSFGESLRYPFFSGFASFWDGVYSTLWGDGLVAGMIRIATRHAFWNYEAMTAVYPLALPATALFALGYGRLVRDSLTDPTTRRRLVLSMLTTVLFVLAFSLLLITLRLPFYAQAKAPYVLAATLPIALAGAEGLSWLPRRLSGGRGRPWGALYFGWLVTLAGAIVLAFQG